MGRKPQKSVGRYCAVRSCSSKGKGCSFFSFPKDDRLLKWIENCKRHDMLKKDLASLWKTYYVCGKHFERRMFLNNLQNRLHSHAIPTLLLTATKPSSKQVETNDISTNTREDSIETLESSNTTRVPLDLNASEPLFNVVRSSDIQLDSQESSFQHIVISEPGPSDASEPSCKIGTLSDVQLDFQESSFQHLVSSEPRSSDMSGSPPKVEISDTQLDPEKSSLERLVISEPALWDTFGFPCKIETLDTQLDPQRSSLEQLVISEPALSDITSSSSMALQTQCPPSTNSPRKLKFKRKLKCSHRGLLRLKPTHSLTGSLQDFLKLCDTHLQPELATIVKFITENKQTKLSAYSLRYKQFALNIYFLGPKVYTYLSKILQLPNTRILRRWTKSWDIPEGFCRCLFNAVRLKTTHFKSEARECVLCIDEITLKCNPFYNRGKEEVIKFHETNGRTTAKPTKCALVLFAKGIHVNWKQPIAYILTHCACRGQDLKNILVSAIMKLKEINLHVRAIISNAGSKFFRFSKVLNVKPETPYFFINGEKIFYLYDTPHLLKAMRNTLLKYNIHFGEYVVSKQYIQQFYDSDKKMLIRVAPKLTDSHINPSTFEKTKVKFAAQIFSRTIAAALSTYISLGVLPPTAIGTALFIEKIDQLFDILNSSGATNTKPYKLPFTGETYQIDFLNEMMTIFENIKVTDCAGVDKISCIKKFKCWRITINAILSLWEEMGKPTFCTTRLQRDSLQIFFRAIRQQCGNTRYPTPVQFRTAFKKVFFTNYFQHTEGANCAEDFEMILNQLQNPIPTGIQDLLSARL